MNEIDRWISSGAGVEEGLRLLSIHAPNRWLAELVSRLPDRFGHLLRKALIPFSESVSFSQTVARGDGSFRKEWPFLAEPDCPPELKILAADMITSWHGYVNAHEDLYNCVSPEACYDTARKTVDNFSQNCKIRSEFQYYKEHRRVLGKHPVFATTRRLKELRTLPVTSLVRKQRALKGNIWRISHEMAKGDRPDLQEDRAARLAQRKLELAEVERMIQEYERSERRDNR